MHHWVKLGVESRCKFRFMLLQQKHFPNIPNMVHCIDANRDHFQGLTSVEEIINLDQLIIFCTTIIFNCTAQHAAVNDSQYNMFSFQPNMPLHLYGNPPTNKVHFNYSYYSYYVKSLTQHLPNFIHEMFFGFFFAWVRKLVISNLKSFSLVL